MNEDDPFGIGDSDKTVFRPSTRPPPPAAPPPAMPSADPALTGEREAEVPGFRHVVRQAARQGRAPSPAIPDGVVPWPRTGVNRLAAYAAPLLGLVARLRSATIAVPIEQLRTQVADALRDFQEHATQMLGSRPDHVRTAHYALCATIDDVVLNTPWGNRSPWATASMVSTFHNEVTGGERFYELLGQLLHTPAANREVIELMYLCLALGFEGRYRLSPHGPAELARLRDVVIRTLAETGPPAERELSLRWRGADAPHRPTARAVPLWAAAVAAVAGVLAVHIGFSYALNVRSDVTMAGLAGLPPTAPMPIERPAPFLAAPGPGVAAEPAVTAALPAPARDDGASGRFRRLLQPEIDERLVSVLDTPDGALIRVLSRNAFRSGSATLEPAVRPVIERIGRALAPEQGEVVVVGHTDRVPIRSIRFPSNWHLSKARADAVRELLARSLDNPARLSAEGHADMEPVASNDDPEGREMNRRTDILLRPPAAVASR